MLHFPRNEANGNHPPRTLRDRGIAPCAGEFPGIDQAVEVIESVRQRIDDARWAISADLAVLVARDIPGETVDVDPELQASKAGSF